MEKVLAAIKNLEAKIGLVETKLESKIGLVENKIDMVEHKMEGEIAVVNKTINSIYDMNKNLRWYIVTTIAIVGGIISLVIAFK